MHTGKRFNTFVLIFLLSFSLKSQQLTSTFTPEKIEKGRVYCEGLDLRTVNEEKTFLYCKNIYTQKNNFREALNVMLMADRKFPYSYDVRLQKALALKQVGNIDESTREISGLILLYPFKFELHNYLARIQYDENRIRSVLPFMVSVILEPDNPISEENLMFIKRLLSNKSLPHDFDRNSSFKITKRGENDFEQAIYELNMNTEGMEIKNDADYLKKRIGVLSRGLENTNSQKRGFFWDFYAAYLLDLHQQNLTNTAIDHMLKRNIGSRISDFKNVNRKYKLK